MSNPHDKIRAVTLTVVLAAVSTPIAGVTKNGELFVVINEVAAERIETPLVRRRLDLDVKQSSEKAA